MPIQRQLELKYGSITIGGAPFKLHGNIVHSKSYVSQSVSFTVILGSSSITDLAAMMKKFEDGMRKPEQDLSIRQGGNTIVDLKGNHQSGSGARPIVSRPDDIKWGGIARRYDVVISYDIQADNNPDTDAWPRGLIDKTDSIIYSPSGRAVITITGTFTSLAGQAASKVYESKVDKVYDAVKATYNSLKWDSKPSSGPELVRNNTDDRITFTTSFNELLFDQGPSVQNHDDPDVVNDSLSFVVNQNQPGNDRRAARFNEVHVTYSASIRKEVTDLKVKADSIKNWLINIIPQVTGVYVDALIGKSEPEIDPVENTISMSLLTVGNLGAATGGSAITLTVDTETKIDDGSILVSVWDGNPDSRYFFQGPRTTIVTCIVQGRFRGTMRNGDDFLNPPSGPNKRINYSNSITPLVIGQGDQQLIVTDVRTVASWQTYSPAAIPVMTPGATQTTGAQTGQLLEAAGNDREPAGAVI